MASSLENAINEDHLTCQICLSPFTKPKALPCLHTFCESCLVLYINRNGHQSKDRLLCPTCRTDIKMPENGVVGFPNNHLVTSLQHTLSLAGQQLAKSTGIPLIIKDAPLALHRDRKFTPRLSPDIKRQISLPQHSVNATLSNFTRQCRITLENTFGDTDEGDGEHDMRSEFAVPREFLGRIIGTNGSKIKEIARTTGTRLSFINRHGSIMSSGKKLLKIIGTRADTQKAKQIVEGIINEEKDIHTDTMDVPDYAMGRIIGTGGSTIRALHESTGASITTAKLSNESSDGITLHRISIRGKSDQLLKAKEQILEILNKIRPAPSKKFQLKAEYVQETTDYSLSMRVLQTSLTPVYAMSKKKHKLRKVKGQNAEPSDSSDEGGGATAASGQNCSHISKGVNFASMRKAILKKTFAKCQTCGRDTTPPVLLPKHRQQTSESQPLIVNGDSSQAGEDEVAEEDTVWVCLQCGFQGCGRGSTNKHALRHYNSPHSSCHSVVINANTWAVCATVASTSMVPVFALALLAHLARMAK